MHNNSLKAYFTSMLAANLDAGPIIEQDMVRITHKNATEKK